MTRDSGLPSECGAKWRCFAGVGGFVVCVRACVCVVANEIYGRLVLAEAECMFHRHFSTSNRHVAFALRPEITGNNKNTRSSGRGRGQARSPTGAAPRAPRGDGAGGEGKGGRLLQRRSAAGSDDDDNDDNDDTGS